jgi:hypothetical protein
LSVLALKERDRRVEPQHGVRTSPTSVSRRDVNASPPVSLSSIAAAALTHGRTADRERQLIAMALPSQVARPQSHTDTPRLNAFN